MTISYKWLCEYLPHSIEIEKLSKILTSVGLEVESITPYQEFKNNLEGIVVGEVLECEKHPDADKLKITKVNIGLEETLQIVCGAPNVAIGQKVIVALIGTTIYPINSEPITMKKAKLRGVESFGMICAEDEIGLSSNHDGIMILDNNAVVGSKLSDYFNSYSDYIIEIGLTPNHMDAQCHIGVARDVIAYLNHHEKSDLQLKLPYPKTFKADSIDESFKVKVENKDACKRYTGLSISNISVAKSPKWLQQKLIAIGLRPINNIVDITNYVLHETGQPLHAFDANKIDGKELQIKCVANNTAFVTLDEKERKLTENDLMICNAYEPMCIAGVFGGLQSGVTKNTKNIFLESAVFDATYIRKTSVHHGLRTDAAVRFEKGIDISNTANVLKRAAILIKEIAGGTISSEVIDIYPEPIAKNIISIKYHYLKKLSGKNYHQETVKNVFQNLGFEIEKDGIDEITVSVPYHKTDISIPADLVEEIMRIDGLDNIEIPKSISISPSSSTDNDKEKLKEKIAQILVGIGFQEIFTNSITNEAFVNEDLQSTMVKMMNNLSAELNVMRTTMLETGLQSIAYNINRKNNNLQFFEFGRTYTISEIGKYSEKEHLAIYITGLKTEQNWRNKTADYTFYDAKNIAEKILFSSGIPFTTNVLENGIIYLHKNIELINVTEVNTKTLKTFDIKQPIFYIDCSWENIVTISKNNKITYQEISKFPTVQRDIAVVVDKNINYSLVENAILKANIKKLSNINLFDIFENEKLGINKKSLAINFSFVDTEKTLTENEIEGFMQKILLQLEKETNAVLRN